MCPELDPEQGVHADRRLVEEQDRRAVDERAGEREAAALAARQGAGDRVDAVAEVDDARASPTADDRSTPYVAAKNRAFSPTVSAG